MNLIILATSVPEVTYGSVSIWTLTRWPVIVTVTRNPDTSLYGCVTTDGGFMLYEQNMTVGNLPQTLADTLSTYAIQILSQAKPTTTIPGLVGSKGTALITFADNGGAGSSWAQVDVSDVALTNDTVQVFIMSVATADHTAEEHRILDLYSSKTANIFAPGVQFRIYIDTTLRLRGSFQVGYTRT